MDEGTREFFNARAAGWTQRCWAEWLAGRAPELRGKLERLFDAALVGAGSRVLDVGCGDGFLVRPVLERIGAAGRLAELDIAERMIAENRRLHGADPRLHFMVADAADLAGAAEFDAVLVFSCFPHFREPVATLSRLATHLRTRGRLAVCHTRSSREMNAFHRHAHPDVADDCLPPARDMLSLLRQAGLRPLTGVDMPGLYLVVGERADRPSSDTLNRLA